MEPVHPAGNPASLRPGMEVGSWRIVSRHGHGSYGVIYRAVKVGDPEAVPRALKMALYPRDPRFEREGELLSRIVHRHVPRLHDRGVWMAPGDVPFPYLVMDWIEGMSLYAWAEQQPRTQHQVLQVLAQVARALEATHAVEGVHRDVKGANILVHKEDGHAVLTDFGSGIYRGASVLTRQPPPPGTPQYQSPESMRFQWEHLRQPSARYEACPADDVYALGMTAYRLVTGRYPPPTVELEETEQGTRLIHLPLVPPERWGTLAPELAALIRRMLSENPAARGSAGELAQAIEGAVLAAGSTAKQPGAPRSASAPPVRTPQTSPQRRFMGGASWLAAVAMLLVLGTWWTRNSPAGELPVGLSCEPQDNGMAEEGTADLGDTALLASACAGNPVPVPGGVHRSVPKDPFRGQRRPPCDKHATEINGGCWGRVNGATPPCGDQAYEWNQGCYWPILSPPRPAASDPH